MGRPKGSGKYLEQLVIRSSSSMYKALALRASQLGLSQSDMIRRSLALILDEPIDELEKKLSKVEPVTSPQWIERPFAAAPVDIKAGDTIRLVRPRGSHSWLVSEVLNDKGKRVYKYDRS